ncbi:ACP S-malonyltransferase [Dehalobacter sp. DCM]|uniref:ACP S-malonyltransferase n=1 Tax=Dehalobacter sp. DCM TaxID=2907827 RepID=UPI003081ABBC|nr:ACP S-malonyltransferase [Dehalobacter sp. DCM]
MTRKKTAFIFAGQGSQYVGMGKELYEYYPAARTVFELADRKLGYNLSELCFSGPKEELDRTENTQPAILAVSVAAVKTLADYGIYPDVVAGFSLGEYSALVCSQVLTFDDGVQLVRKRGLFMQEAVPQGLGGMAAVLGLDTDKVEEACHAAEAVGVVQIANYNCPGQVVISGQKQALEAASAKATELGAKRVLPLEVSGPFHTVLLKPAADKLAEELAAIPFNDPAIPVLSNVTADYMSDKMVIKDLMPKQVMNPVRWETVFRKMLADGVETFVELGPGTVLKGFARKIDRDIKVLSAENKASLEAAIDYIKNN